MPVRGGILVARFLIKTPEVREVQAYAIYLGEKEGEAWGGGGGGGGGASSKSKRIKRWRGEGQARRGTRTVLSP